MTAEQYLSQYRLLSARLAVLESNIKAIQEERITLRSAWPDGQPHGTMVGDPTAHKAIELTRTLAGYENKQRKLKAELWGKRQEIVDTINLVPDPNCMTLLFLRYINLLTWEEVAVCMGYSYRWVAGALHDKSLGMIDEIINKNRPAS